MEVEVEVMSEICLRLSKLGATISVPTMLCEKTASRGRL